MEHLTTILLFHGKDRQILVAIEEFAELTQQLCKLAANRPAPGLMSELADAKLMLLQLELIFDCTDAVEVLMLEKIQRELNRIRQPPAPPGPG